MKQVFPDFMIIDFLAAFICPCGTSFNVQCKYPEYKFACPKCATTYTIDLARGHHRILFK